jgi:K+-sensing histidine kinase KdpD
VTNDGASLTEEEIATFGKKRATRKLNDKTEGKISVGLGAVIMNKICEIHSGEMKIENNPDGGAKFTISFPYLKI